MAALSKDIVGKTMDPFSFTIEQGKIREFCLAIGDDNPIFLDPEKAKAAGYKDTPMTLTLPTAFIMWGYGFQKLFDSMAEMGIDTGRLLHLKEEYQYEQPLYPGDTVTGQVKVADVKTGKMDMATFETVFTKEDGSEALKALMTIVIRPEGM